MPTSHSSHIYLSNKRDPPSPMWHPTKMNGPKMRLRPCCNFFFFSFFFYFTNTYLPLNRLLPVQHHLDASQAGLTMAHSPRLAMSSHLATMKGARDSNASWAYGMCFFFLSFVLSPSPLFPFCSPPWLGPHCYWQVRLPLPVWDIFALVFIYMLIIVYTHYYPRPAK